MENKILIFGRNGAGKSFFTENVKNLQLLDKKIKDFNQIKSLFDNKKVITFNSNIENWYLKEKNIFSEFLFLFSNEINQFKEKIDLIKIDTIFNEELEKIKSLDKYDYQGYKSLKKEFEEYSNSNVELHSIETIKNFKNIFKDEEGSKWIKKLNFTKEEINFIYFVKKYFSKNFDNKDIELNFGENKELIESVVSLINNVKNKRTEIIDKKFENHPEHLKIKEYIEDVLNLSQIKHIISKKICVKDIPNIIFDEINKQIKIHFFQNENIRNLLNTLFNNVEHYKKTSTNFSDLYIDVTDNGYEITHNGLAISNINISKEKFSDGQKLMFILENIIKPIFNLSNITIVFDDFFEKMDFNNLINSYEILSKMKQANIIIFTHNEFHFDLYNDIEFNESKKCFCPYLIANCDNNTFKIIKKENICLTFRLLTKCLFRDLNNKNAKHSELEPVVNFCKYLNRDCLRQASIHYLDLNNCNERDKNYQLYCFLSEYIFHCNEFKINDKSITFESEKNKIVTIDKEIINKFSTDILDKYKNGDVFIKDYLIKYFEHYAKNENKFGISFQKVVDYLKNLNESKDWNDKKERNFIAHRPEQSLIDFLDFDL